MLPNGIDGALHRMIDIPEAGQPLLHVFMVFIHMVNRFLRNAAFLHLGNHFLRVKQATAAIIMPNDNDRIHAQLIDCDQKAENDTAIGVHHAAACVFNQLDIAVFQAKGGRQKLRHAGIHTGKNGDFTVRILGCGILFIETMLHEGTVIIQHLLYEIIHKRVHLVHRFFILYSFLRILSLFVWQNITKK